MTQSLAHAILADAPLDARSFADLGGPDLVYVRTVSAAEVIRTVPAEVVKSFGVQPPQTLYAVHRGDGERIAVLTDRDSAFAAALMHELAPVSVH